MKTQETAQTLPFEYGKPAIPAYLRAANSEYKTRIRNGEPISRMTRACYNMYQRWVSNMNINPNTATLTPDAKRAITAFVDYLNGENPELAKALELHRNVAEQIAFPLMDAADGAAAFAQLQDANNLYKRNIRQGEATSENTRLLFNKYVHVVNIRKKFIKITMTPNQIRSMMRRTEILSTPSLRNAFIIAESMQMRGEPIPDDIQKQRDEYVDYWDKKFAEINVLRKRNQFMPVKKSYIPTSLRRMGSMYTLMMKLNKPVPTIILAGISEYRALRHSKTLENAFQYRQQQYGKNTIIFDEDTVNALRAASNEYDRLASMNETIDNDLIWAKNKYIQWLFRQ